MVLLGRAGAKGLKVVGKVGEGGQFEELLACGGLMDNLVFEDPGEVVGDEDGIEAGTEGGIDVGAGAVANHPRGAGLAAMVGREGAVGFVVLFGEDFNGGEVASEAGAVEFVGLLLRIALGDEDEAMASGEICQGGGDVGEEFDLLVGDGLGEVGDAVAFFRGNGSVGKLLKAGDEGVAEAVQAVAPGEDGGVFDAVEVAADLLGRVDAVVEVGDERGDGALEVDVVLPESVIRVDEQGLAGGLAEGLSGVAHILIISGGRLAARVGNGCGDDTLGGCWMGVWV